MSAVGTTNASVRETWVANALKQLPAGARILDAGAGECPHRKACSHLVYVSQDFGKYQGAGDGRGLQTGKWDRSGIDIVSDITAIPEADQSFDAILCTEVFEHIPEPIAALKEFSRLLKQRLDGRPIAHGLGKAVRQKETREGSTLRVAPVVRA